MTNEHKDELTGLCKIEIKRWKAASESNPNMRYMVDLMEIALAALTAQPVKLPHKHVVLGSNNLVSAMSRQINKMRSECADAIRAAGYEVQE